MALAAQSAQLVSCRAVQNRGARLQGHRLMQHKALGTMLRPASPVFMASRKSTRAGGRSLVVQVGAKFLDDDEESFFKTVIPVGLSIYLLTTCIKTVPPGSVALPVTLGSVGAAPLQSGIKITTPVTKLVEYSLRTKLLDSENQVPTSEGVTVELDVSLLYHVEPSKARELYLSAGENFEDVLIAPALRAGIRNLTSEASAKDLYTSGREAIRDRLQVELAAKLGERGIVIEDVLLKNLTLPPVLTNAIESKLATEQESQRMQFVLEKERQEAERKAIEAEGLADFQKIVSEGISPELLRWKGIEATEKLAESPNAKIVIIGKGDDGLPVILGGTAQD